MISQESCTAREINAQYVAVICPSSLLEAFSGCCCGTGGTWPLPEHWGFWGAGQRVGATGHRRAVLGTAGFGRGLPGVRWVSLPSLRSGAHFSSGAGAKRRFVPGTDVLMIVDFCSIRRTKRGLKSLFKELIAPARVVIVSE